MKHYPKQLLAKYRTGACTEKEIAFVESWYIQMEYLAGNPSEDMLSRTKQEVWKNLSASQITTDTVKLKTTPFYKKWNIAAAALLFIIAGTGLYIYLSQSKSPKETTPTDQFTAIPNRAVLTLADGSTINLDDTKNVQLSQQAGISVKKIKGELVYESKAEEKNTDASLASNTIQTPAESQFKVVLPDGSSVWLNAGSSLKYPLHFARNNRSVTLQGEGYFEVFKDKRRPFRVVTSLQTVQVLGTHFNISAYSNQKVTRTTLLEGSVRVTGLSTQQTAVLTPNQQAVLTSDKVSVITVDATEAIAWRDGYFSFNNYTLEEVMNGLARWYKIDVAYPDPALKRELFSGSLPHSSNVKQVLKKLELAGKVKFEIEGNKITVLGADK